MKVLYIVPLILAVQNAALAEPVNQGTACDIVIGKPIVPSEDGAGYGPPLLYAAKGLEGIEVDFGGIPATSEGQLVATVALSGRCYGVRVFFTPNEAAKPHAPSARSAGATR